MTKGVDYINMLTPSFYMRKFYATQLFSFKAGKINNDAKKAKLNKSLPK